MAAPSLDYAKLFAKDLLRGSLWIAPTRGARHAPLAAAPAVRHPARAGLRPAGLARR